MKPPGGWPQRTRILTCRGTRSTSGTPMPRRGCPSTAQRTGGARSTATNPGTTNCAPRRSITVALRCTPTLRTIRGCTPDRLRAVTTAVERGAQGVRWGLTPRAPSEDAMKMRLEAAVAAAAAFVERWSAESLETIEPAGLRELL